MLIMTPMDATRKDTPIWVGIDRVWISAPISFKTFAPSDTTTRDRPEWRRPLRRSYLFNQRSMSHRCCRRTILLWTCTEVDIMLY